MKTNEKNAKKFFLEHFPDGVGYDIVGRKMLLDDYGNSKVETGWNVDHILPISRGGNNKKENLQCMNIKTNSIKGSKTTWIDEKMILQVRRNKGCHSIIKVSENIGEKEYNLDDKGFVLNLFKKKYPLGVGYDMMGRKMLLEDYLNKSVYSGWGIVKLNPRSPIIDERNTIILNVVSINEKKEKTAWTDNERYFQVEKDKNRFFVVEVIHKDGITTKKGEVVYGFNA
jgi:hypothetical protein